ncbi:dual specificity phosphatase, catalytic domain-containing protein [Ditylenchus destructor]|uniref:Dual specificity phosphatase, catalytic domain-containing protein n=1 Tax=Ditylenchus destructor TaxID=166010 RepID=A0AAD4NBE3_9BILA|nr:dual specificity phosphatase, catalytic domain-containing protein [Ditylenchus destructor]
MTEPKTEQQAFGSLKVWRQKVGSGMDEILPGLFVGSLRDALDANQIEQNGIEAVVSVHDFHNDYLLAKNQTDLKWIRIRLSDAPDQDALSHFSAVNSFIHSFRLQKKNVLVHCLAGVSRSVCLIVQYVMTVTNLEYPSALLYVTTKRITARPNFGFRMQLRKFGDYGVFEERKRLSKEFQGSREKFAELHKIDCDTCDSECTLDLGIAHSPESDSSETLAAISFIDD